MAALGILYGQGGTGFSFSDGGDDGDGDGGGGGSGTTTPTVDFSGDVLSGTPPLLVTFTASLVSGDPAVTYGWDFGDGKLGAGASGVIQHQYAEAGTYSVSCAGFNAAGQGPVETKVAYITVGEEAPQIVSLTGSPTEGDSPLDVSFTAQLSGGPVTSYAWTFGDGGSSTLASPNHTYTEAGNFTVSLTVTGPGGSDSFTRTSYIMVNEPDVGDPPAGASQEEITFEFGVHPPESYSSGKQWTNLFLSGTFWTVSDGQLATLLPNGQLGAGYPDPSVTPAGVRCKPLEPGLVDDGEGAFGSGTMTVLWEGPSNSSVTVQGMGASEVSRDVDPETGHQRRTYTYNDTPSGGLSCFITSFGTGAASNPVRNIRIYEDGYDDSSGLVHPRTLEFYNQMNFRSGTRALRFAASQSAIRYDLEDTGESDPRAAGMSDFAQRTLPGQLQIGWKGECLEYICAESNIVFSHGQPSVIHVNFKPPSDAQRPDVSSSEYQAWKDGLQAAASILLNGSTVDGVFYPGLDEHIKVRVQLGLELWNTQFFGGRFHYNREVSQTGLTLAQAIARDMVALYDAFIAAGWTHDRLEMFTDSSFIDPTFGTDLLAEIKASYPSKTSGFAAGKIGPALYYGFSSAQLAALALDPPADVEEYFDEIETTLATSWRSLASDWITQTKAFVALNPEFDGIGYFAYEGNPNREPEWNNFDQQVQFDASDLIAEANQHPRAYKTDMMWRNIMVDLGYEGVMKFQLVKKWLDTGADSQSWGDRAHNGHRIATRKFERGRIFGPIEVLEGYPRARAAMEGPSVSSRGLYQYGETFEAPPRVFPHGAPQWDVYADRYVRLSDGAVFSGDKHPLAACANTAANGDMIRVVESQYHADETIYELGSATGNGAAVIRHKGGSDPLALTIYSEDRDGIFVAPHTYKDWDGATKTSGAAEVEWWNLTIQNTGYGNRYCINWQGAETPGGEVAAGRVFLCNFVGAGDGGYNPEGTSSPGYGMFAAIRGFQVKVVGFEARGCMFGSLSDGRSMPVLAFDGVSAYSGVPGVHEHCFYSDPVKGLILMDNEVCEGPQIGQEFLVADGNGAKKLYGSYTRTFNQITQRLNEVPSVSEGVILIENNRTRNHYGNRGSATHTTVGAAQATVIYRNNSYEDGLANVVNDETNRQILTWTDEDKGRNAASPGGNAHRDVIVEGHRTTILANTVVGNPFSFRDADRVILRDFELTGPGAAVWLNTPSNQFESNYPVDDFQFQLAPAGSKTTDYPGFKTSTSSGRKWVRDGGVDLTAAQVDATYPNQR